MRPFHCSSVGLTPAITPNVGNSTVQFLVVGTCVRASPLTNVQVKVVCYTGALMQNWTFCRPHCLVLSCHCLCHHHLQWPAHRRCICRPPLYNFSSQQPCEENLARVNCQFNFRVNFPPCTGKQDNTNAASFNQALLGCISAQIVPYTVLLPCLQVACCVHAPHRVDYR